MTFLNSTKAEAVSEPMRVPRPSYRTIIVCGMPLSVTVCPTTCCRTPNRSATSSSSGSRFAARPRRNLANDRTGEVVTRAAVPFSGIGVKAFRDDLFRSSRKRPHMKETMADRAGQ